VKSCSQGRLVEILAVFYSSDFLHGCTPRIFYMGLLPDDAVDVEESGEKKRDLRESQ
jgi:hypothetical protein